MGVIEDISRRQNRRQNHFNHGYHRLNPTSPFIHRVQTNPARSVGRFEDLSDHQNLDLPLQNPVGNVAHSPTPSFSATSSPVLQGPVEDQGNGGHPSQAGPTVSPDNVISALPNIRSPLHPARQAPWFCGLEGCLYELIPYPDQYALKSHIMQDHFECVRCGDYFLDGDALHMHAMQSGHHQQ